MKTDDLLTDLGQQLRTATPRRDPRPVLALAVLAALAIAALALAPRGREPEPAAPVVTGKPRVAVRNGTAFPGVASRTAAGLRRAGYRVVDVSDDPKPGAPQTMVGAVDPRFAAQARQLRRRLGAAPLTRDARRGAVTPKADIVVVLGADGSATPLSATVPRVRVVNQSGSVDWAEQVAARLRARGATVTEVVRAGHAFRTRVVPIGDGDLTTAAEAAADVGVPGAVSPRGSSTEGGAANTVVFLGSDLPGATLLESALGTGGGSCQPTPDGHGPLYRCELPDRAYSVRVTGDCYDAKPLGRRPGRELSGCGVRP